MKVHHVVYVPGLGDAQVRGQKLVTQLWRILGVHGYYAPVQWADKEPWESKLRRLLALIDELDKTGTVSLIGASAGASAVLQAYAQRKNVVAGVVCICGKINHPETVTPSLYRKNPAFQVSLVWLQQALPSLSLEDRAQILSIHPLWDGSVPVADTILPGAREHTVPTAGHAFSIFCMLVFGAPNMMRFLMRQAVRRSEASVLD